METSNNIAVNGPAFSLSRSLPAKTPGSLNRGQRNVKITRPLKDGASGSARPERVRLGIDRLKVIHSRLNSAARTIRVADETMGKIESYIDRMEAELQRIIKNYPPFPAGSEERVKRLKSINAFRKLIDQLTIPPPNDEFAVKIMAHRDAVSKTDDSKKMPGENKFYRKIHSHQAHTGPEWLGFPQVQEDANDEEIRSALENLEISKERLRQRRSELAADLAGIINSYEREVEAAGIFHSYGDEFESVDTEAETELKSREFGYTLAIEPGMTLTEAQSQLLSLLN